MLKENGPKNNGATGNGAAVKAAVEIELTPDEVKLLAFFQELREGCVPFEWFVDMAEQLGLENATEAVNGLLEKEVLTSDVWSDEHREDFNMLPLGEQAYEETLFSISDKYRAAVKKYIPEIR